MTAKAALNNLKSISEQFAPKSLRLMLQKMANKVDETPDFGISHMHRKRTDTFICLVSQFIDHQDGPDSLFTVADPSIIYSLLQRYSLVTKSLSQMPTKAILPLSPEPPTFIKQLMIDLYYEITGDNGRQSELMTNDTPIKRQSDGLK